MAHNTSISLGSHFLQFVEDQIESGRYSSTSDVIRAGLRLLEDQETRISALREALIEGELSGTATPFDLERFLASKRDESTQ